MSDSKNEIAWKIKEIFLKNKLNSLLFFIPLTLLFEIFHANQSLIFLSSALAIIPLAGLMGKATEHLAEKLGAGIGGLLNASFGNAAELIIALIALNKGFYDVVKASITGSIIGNILLVLGLSILVGAIKYEKQTFNRTAAGVGSTLLVLSAVGLVVPAIFHELADSKMSNEQELSLEIAIVLFVVYLLSLFFALRTHKHLYVGDSGDAGSSHAPENHRWSRNICILVLLASTAFVALMSEFLIGSVEHTAKAFGMTQVFVGVILVAVIGNAAEHSSAVIAASKNHLDLAISISIGSSIQIALFVTPVLVFFSYLLAKPMDLLFTTFEVMSVVLAVGIVNFIAADGETNWMEGVQLLAVYVILAIAFYYLP